MYCRVTVAPYQKIATATLEATEAAVTRVETRQGLILMGSLTTLNVVDGYYY